MNVNMCYKNGDYQRIFFFWYEMEIFMIGFYLENDRKSATLDFVNSYQHVSYTYKMYCRLPPKNR